MIFHGFQFPIHNLSPEYVRVVILEVFEDRLDSFDFVVQKRLTVLVMPHSNIISHVVVVHQVVHVSVFLSSSVNTGLSILSL
jgi:hypothetical protein